MSQKNKRNYENYYLGLDIGTDSVGWAVTDTNYKLLRANNKNLWGVRLFDSAQSASNRRLSRESRRRLERRKWRIELLQEIFAPVINQIDGNFFARLSDSNLYDGDKREKTKFSLFNDKDYTDKEFYKKYKTIYHLRLAMMTETDPDPRLVYLALHHIIKYRGHFLQEGDSVSVIDNIEAPLNSIACYLSSSEKVEQLNLTKEIIKKFQNCLVEKGTKSERAQRYKDCFDAPKNSRLEAVLKLIAGNSVKIKALFPDTETSLSVTFDCEWEAKESEYRELLQDDYILIENAKLLYDYAQLKTILGNYSFLSEGMVERYKKHSKDLADLKRVLKKYFPQETYDLMFKKNDKETNYTAYSGKVNFGKKVDGNKQLLETAKSRSYEDFVKYVKSILTSYEQAQNDETVQRILSDMADGTFMPKQVSKRNSTLPYQLNLAELETILKNIIQYPRYAFINETDKSGIRTYDKIKSLLTFKMPYYVGPTNNHSGKYWIVRSESGKILPWNYEQKIDLFATENNFVQRMTNKCPYVDGAKVLPKCSLLYEEFAFLNVVNCIRINGTRLSVDLKLKLSEYYATNGESKLTAKILKQWLKLQNVYEDNDKIEIDGFDDGATVHRRTYYQFVKIFDGSVRGVEEHREDIEKIILYATIAGPEKNNLVKRLKKEFDYLTEQQISIIKGLSLKGWGRYSKEMLTKRIGTDPDTGELHTLSIIDAMRNSQYNFMEIWNNEVYGFKDGFNQLRDNISSGISYDVVDSLYCSPAVKKQIWQTLCIVKELTDILGRAPSKIFVEVARDTNSKKDKSEERKRNASRYQMLSAALDKLKEQRDDMFNENVYKQFCELKPESLQNTKLFLYFMQNGIDIYTGDVIDYNNLHLYDKDHIYPRSKVKDDSIHSNLVLTYRTHNAVKTDTYPIEESVRKKMESKWLVLKKQGLMSEEKYRRLTRNTPLTDDELADFINRQLVETRQTTKEVIELLKGVFPESEIVWSKAGNISDFRAMPKQMGEQRVSRFVKCRELNDLHHAKDAYLNIVVGNVYNVRYEHNARFWMKNHPTEKLVSPAKLFEHDVKNKSVVAWIAGEDGTMAQVEKTMRSNAVLFTRESKVVKGQLFEATLQKKNADNANLVPLKGENSTNRKYKCMSDTAKYGGYISETRAYYMLVKYTQVKQTKKKQNEKCYYKLLGVTAKDSNKLLDNKSRIDYCEKCGLQNARILIPRIKVQTMFEFGNTLLSLSGMTGNRIIWRIAQQNACDEETERYLKKVVNVVEKYNKASVQKQAYNVTDYDEITLEQNKILYDVFMEKLSSSKYSGAASLQSFVNKLSTENLRQKFANLCRAKQCVVLAEIAKALQCNATTSNLSLVGEGKSCGNILTSSVFEALDNISIVHRSVTGIFEQKIPLSQFDKESNR